MKGHLEFISFVLFDQTLREAESKSRIKSFLFLLHPTDEKYLAIPPPCVCDTTEQNALLIITAWSKVCAG